MMKPKPPEQFETARLLGRAAAVADAEAIFAQYAQDGEVAKYMIWRPHQHVSETKEFLQRCEEGWRNGTACPWVLTLKESGRLIGMVELRPNDWRADLGYVLERASWGQGYMTEAVRFVAEWALSQPGVYRVWATCDVDNLASARVLEKVGMQREGVLRRWIMHPNISEEPRDCYCYALIK
jgi:[ribosomal protein S5]-alanine N-acetyltransferase